MLSQINNNLKNLSKIHTEFDFKLNFDGCSKGNPGKSGAGAVITYVDTEIWSGSLFVGLNETNNYAEYCGMIFGLTKAVEMNIKKVIVIGDSLLVINHMKGIYKCTSLNLVSLYYQAKELEKKFECISYEHVLRDKNKRADELSNLALKQDIL